MHFKGGTLILFYYSSQTFLFLFENLGEELLAPTKIYVRNVLAALQSGRVKALAHITGGGLTENIPRVLPPGMRVTVDATNWNILPVFAWLAATGWFVILGWSIIV